MVELINWAAVDRTTLCTLLLALDEQMRKQELQGAVAEELHKLHRQVDEEIVRRVRAIHPQAANTIVEVRL